MVMKYLILLWLAVASAALQWDPSGQNQPNYVDHTSQGRGFLHQLFHHRPGYISQRPISYPKVNVNDFKVGSPLLEVYRRRLSRGGWINS
ncbi:unnamed protein product [Colias eurytheme]|nr:unnamed protein product [Colias eurytheme]